MDPSMNWETLGTAAGAATVTTAITGALKRLFNVSGKGVEVLAILGGAVVCSVANYVMGRHSWQQLVQAFITGVFAGIGAIGLNRTVTPISVRLTRTPNGGTK